MRIFASSRQRSVAYAGVWGSTCSVPRTVSNDRLMPPPILGDTLFAYSAKGRLGPASCSWGCWSKEVQKRSSVIRWLARTIAWRAMCGWLLKKLRLGYSSAQSFREHCSMFQLPPRQTGKL